MSEKCSLCRLERGLIAEDDHWAMALNDNQASLGRVFFALKRHETDITRLTQEERDALWRFVARAKQALTALFTPDHYNYMFLMNIDPHVHFHIFPRYAESRRFSGHTFTDERFGGHYDPAQTKPLDDDTHASLVTAIRAALPA